MVTDADCPNPEYTVKTPIRTADAATNALSDSKVAWRDQQKDGGEDEEKAKGGMGTVMGVLIPFGLVFLAVGWVTYAYRNPHTKSGQFLIQVRIGCIGGDGDS